MSKSQRGTSERQLQGTSVLESGQELFWCVIQPSLSSALVRRIRRSLLRPGGRLVKALKSDSAAPATIMGRASVNVNAGRPSACIRRILAHLDFTLTPLVFTDKQDLSFGHLVAKESLESSESTLRTSMSCTQKTRVTSLRGAQPCW